MSFFVLFFIVEVSVFMCLFDYFWFFCKNVWGDVNWGGLFIDFFFEGLFFDCQGWFYVIDIFYGCIFCISMDG